MISDHARPERQRGETVAFVGRRAQRRLPGDDWGHAERQRFLHPEREATMPVRTFYGWLFMACSYGFVGGVVLMLLVR